MNRCVICGDPASPGWLYCQKCHGYNDLFTSLQHREAGIDTYRLRRGLRAINQHPPRLSVRQLLTKLTRRVEELEDRI